MKTNGTLLKTLVIHVAFILPAGLNSLPAVAEESGAHSLENIAAANILDGKKFIGPTGEKGKKVHHEDILVFSDGKFSSSECFQYGFKPAPYTATVESDSIRFEAETISATHGKMEWKGSLKGDTLEATYTWIKKRWLWTTFREYWFKGTLVE